jgi:uncharacterized protein YegJ (DUF2314 family)
MWLTVEALEGEQVRGRLDNDPVGLKQVRRGDRLTAAPADVTDWLFTEGSELHGAFTVHALKAIHGKG